MATLQKLGDQAQCPINTDRLGLGRAADNEIIIEDDTISGHHAVVIVRGANNDGEGKSYILTDLNSTNKTYVNNKEITRQQLQEGDIIRLGRVRLKFSLQEYIPPQTEFDKTQKLSVFRVPNFLLMKK